MIDQIIDYNESRRGSRDGIDKTSDRSIKSLRDGQLLIERNGKVYNSLGAEVK